MHDPEATFREFLAAHPEHIAGARVAEPHEFAVVPPSRVVMDTTTMVAFVDWCLANGKCDARKARRFREAVRRMFKV